MPEVIGRDERLKRLSMRDGGALIILERTMVQPEEWDRDRLRLLERNGPYSWGLLDNSTRVTLIEPADSEHLVKYGELGRRRRMVCETAQAYEQITKPWIVSQERTSWVDNILKGRAEQPFFSNDQIVILPDSKWTDHSRQQELYLLVLFRNESLRCLRDVADINLLVHVKETLAELLHSMLDTTIDQVAIYFHYPPTYYRLHLHVVHISMLEAASSQVGVAHHLDAVLANLSLTPDYYRNMTIPVLVSWQHPLYNKL